MNIVVPIAGRGSRFVAEAFRNPEYSKPKPLINLAGRTMIEWALASYPLTKDDQLIFIVRQEHLVTQNIDEKLKDIFGNEIKIVVQNTPPIGAACTVLLAKQYINNDESLLVTDSDHYIDGFTHFDEIKKYKDVDGMIPVFYANNNKWSFSSVNSEGHVIEVAEKVQISRTANIGAYYFKKGRDFVWAAEEMIEEGDKTNGEFYVAPVYNYLVRRGKKIRLSRPRFVHGLGTPKDAEKFLEFLELGEIEHHFDNLQTNKEKNTIPKENLNSQSEKIILEKNDKGNYI